MDSQRLSESRSRTPGGPAARSDLRLPTRRELLLVGVVLVVGMVAFRLFDEWRGPIQFVYRLLIVGYIAFVLWRALWSWWKLHAASIATKGALLALAVAVVGWLDVALATAVSNISSSNYSLIIIAPLTMMLGALVSLLGLLAAGLGVAVTITALTHPVPRRRLLVAAGVAAFVLNIAHIVALVRVLWSD